ncbi:GNAT family N-acetyltransferase [Petrocella atlantisensis]|uniref:GNAT family N-acetyltransferase n=1 Tax=Petrocella atlantisensis TaxID=2173034 RepID=A0A3P7NZ23_9FIRM|nr:GNAT family N-acetyltransferase [Petrocella atlantisensis]VDN46570.1 GNAT family N-acetyltransferase [Petrocella atlantisensis]
MNLSVGEYIISDDKKKLQLNIIHELLKGTYWAKDRSIQVIEKSVAHSICYGVYLEDKMVGFGRVVTDYATMYWVADIVIDEAHRGKGLGKELMNCIEANKDIEGLMGILATRDAHGLYQKYGFMQDPEKFMKKPRVE